MSITVNRILALAEHKGVSLDFLNDLIGGYYGKTQGWKTGRTTPTFSELTTLANYFNVSLDYLLGHSSDRAPEPPPASAPPPAPRTGADSYLYIADNAGGRKVAIPPDKIRRVLLLLEAAFPELLE